MIKRTWPGGSRSGSHFILFLILVNLALGAENATETEDSTPSSTEIQKSDQGSIPGCPDIDQLDAEQELTPQQLDNLLLCFCKVTNTSTVSVSCLYGSTVDHLKRAASLVKTAGKEIELISIQHMEFPDSELPQDLLPNAAPNLKVLEIRECNNQMPLLIGDGALQGLEEKLTEVTIHGCDLEQIPPSISSLSNLEILVLSDNKLYNISDGDFDNLSKLKYLDLSSNFINHADEGSFEGLSSLETLVIGDHNYMNETVLGEIGKLVKLQTLDFSRADGIFGLPEELSQLPNLEVLKLSGCSIETIDAGEFSHMPMLKQLDLRVNLIQNVSAFAFDGLKNLQRLSLAGNYIKDIEKDIWSGLDNLQELDIGWNEIAQIPEDAFLPLAGYLQTLNLRHNPISQVDNVRGLNKLSKLDLSECEDLKMLGDGSFKDLPMLEEVDVSRGNLTSLDYKAFNPVKGTLKRLFLAKTKLTALPAELVTSMPALEELDVSGCPLICDDQMGKFVTAVQDKYKEAAKKGMDFLLSNQNETVCDRPYKLRGEGVFTLDLNTLEPYSTLTDTTTVPTTAATQETTEDEEEATTAFVVPNLFVGAKSNESIFKEEPRREVYDINKQDNTKDDEESGSSVSSLLVLGAIAVLTIAAVTAVVMFMKKRQRIGDSSVSGGGGKGQPGAVPKKKDIEDGMVEIELDSRSMDRQKR